MYGGLGMKAGDLDYYAPPDKQKEKPVKKKYKLIVPAGDYTEDSLLKLMWTVFTHRLHHFIRGEGWSD